MTRIKQYDKGFLDGQLSEAEVFLENLQTLKDELNGVGYDSNRSFINTLIADLEKFVGGSK